MVRNISCICQFLQPQEFGLQLKKNYVLWVLVFNIDRFAGWLEDTFQQMSFSMLHSDGFLSFGCKATFTEKSQTFHQSQKHCRGRIQQMMVMRNRIRSVSPETGRDELQVTHPQAQLHPFQRLFSLKISKCRACNRLKLKLQASQRKVPGFTSKIHIFPLKFCCSVTQLEKQY